jgi:N-acetylmuramoyl-L-alanine amidase
MTDNSTYSHVWSYVLLALCAWREARNQGRDGMRAVCWTVRNRVMTRPEHWWGATYPAVILGPWQYSSFHQGDPQCTLFPFEPKNDPAWQDALEVADEVFLGIGDDPTKGATHYYADSIPPPSWAQSPDTVFTVQIGAHRFYKAA